MTEYFGFAFNTIKQRKTRSWLTMLGIIIGIAAVVSLISLGQGLQHTIQEQFEMMGVDKIMIYAGNTMGMGVEGITLTEKDLDTINSVKGVKTTGGMAYKVARVKSGGETKFTWIMGLPTDETSKIIEDMQSFKIAEGRYLKDGDSNKAVIGNIIAEGDFFDKGIKVGDKIKIEGKSFDVIGTLEVIGNPQDDSQILIPLDAARDILNKPDEYDLLISQVQPGFEVSKVAEDIKRKLRKSRDVEEGEEDFSVQTSEQIMESFSVVFTVVQAVLIGIAAISLLVGGIGIMNTMYTAVLERTKEIGIMKAIGARNSNVMMVFLVESGLMGFVGGAIGVLLGVGLSKIVEFAASQANMSILKPYFPWYLIVGALAFSFIVGTLSGILPARQAAGLKPVDALRYE